MKTNLPTQPRLTKNEQNVLTWAFNMAHSIVAGDYKLPKPMNYAINNLQDAVFDLAKERGVSIEDGCSKEYLGFHRGYTEAMKGDDEMMTRQQANEQILGRIREAVAMFPDWRFHQILQNIGVELPGMDQWYEESVDTLKNTNTNINCKD